MKDDASPHGLPGNAPAHQPYVPADRIIPELTWPAVLVGVILGIIFGASSLYLVLKVGMTVSASIPIAVLSITLFRVFTPLFGRNATILENNIVQTTGSAGESIAFGVGVTMPAIMILGYNLELTRVMLVAVLGGLLGILMMIPLRRAFVVKQHGRLPYPEGTACAGVLIVGEKGGTSAATVFSGFGIGFVFWFLAEGFRFFKTVPLKTLDAIVQETTRFTGFFKGAIASVEVAPHLLGVGYIIGTRISCIMVGGGVMASWLLTPAIVFFGDGLDQPLYPAGKLIRDMNWSEIRNAYVLYIGAGAVAAAGIISMCRVLPLIISSIASGLSDLGGRNSTSGGAGFVRGGFPRTDRDMSMKVVLLGCLGLVAAIALAPALKMNIVGAMCILCFGFLFVTVSSRLTGEIGSSSNPISGMTVATLLMTCLIFLVLGWTSADHKLTALSVAGIVCIAASNGGTTSQDLKTGFLVGGTPRHQQVSILVGALTSALVIGGVLMLLNDGGTVYSRTEAPKAVLKLTGTEPKERVAGPYSKDQKDEAGNIVTPADTKEYFAVHVRGNEVQGVEPGKYLVDESGAIRYLVDPAINGRVAKQDNGTPVIKYDAPKAALMSFIIDGILTQKMPWSLVLLGVAIAIILELSGIPSLPFAVGVYLQLSASTPIFFGGMIRWMVERKQKPEDDADMSPGVLLSSGLIAGGTIAGVVAVLIGLSWSTMGGVGMSIVGPRIVESDYVALIPFGLLCLYLYWVGRGRRSANR